MNNTRILQHREGMTIDPYLDELLYVIQVSGILAPLLFILLHVLRPLFFLPVIFICMFGGVLFGATAGAVYSIIGISITSLTFYFVVHRMPKAFTKFKALREKWVGERVDLSIPQVAILRLIPFIHFHLLSFCLIEMTTNFREYMKGSVYSNIPVAVTYTVFGNFLEELSMGASISLILSLIVLFYLFRKKQIIITWNDFFKKSA